MPELRVPVRGTVDLETAQDLQDKLLLLVNTTSADIVLSCKELEFIDSTGIAVFVHTQRLLEIKGRVLRVENLNGMARRLFDLLGLTDLVDVRPSRVSGSRSTGEG
jgi:anti-sigma B factor antagonist